MCTNACSHVAVSIAEGAIDAKALHKSTPSLAFFYMLTTETLHQQLAMVCPRWRLFQTCRDTCHPWDIMVDIQLRKAWRVQAPCEVHTCSTG